MKITYTKLQKEDINNVDSLIHSIDLYTVNTETNFTNTSNYDNAIDIYTKSVVYNNTKKQIDILNKSLTEYNKDEFMSVIDEIHNNTNLFRDMIDLITIAIVKNNDKEFNYFCQEIKTIVDRENNTVIDSETYKCESNEENIEGSIIEDNDYIVK